MKEKIFDYLVDSVSEIFRKIQIEEGIQSGDCPFEIEYDIDTTLENLAEKITLALKIEMA